MRTMPWRDCGSMTGATCHTGPAKLRSVPTGVTVRGHADADDGKILLRKLRLHFHLRRLSDAEQRAGAGADDLADLDIAGEDQAGRRSADVEPADLARECAGKLGLGDPDLGIGGVACRPLLVDFGLGDEAAALERRARARNSFWASAALARADLDLGSELRASCAWTERSMVASTWPCADPGCRRRPGRERPAALAGDADRLVAAGGERRRWR